MSGIKNILVVEDNIANLELFLCLLESQGYKSEVAMDGEKALELIGNSLFDLIILDIKLPKIDGFEVLKRIKTSQNSDTPVIVVTACVTDENKRKILAEGCSSYLTKPFGMSTFCEAISASLSNNSPIDRCMQTFGTDSSTM
ncbi:MAG: response regulator receiver protein [Methanolobus sp. T82-4]|nr:MAG: response regulator receiver protein [Methanolobus sp. T82-4]